MTCPWLVLGESLLGAATAVTLGSLWLADRVHRRLWAMSVPDEPSDPAFDAKVKELERMRERLQSDRIEQLSDARPNAASHTKAAIAECDAQIRALRKRGTIGP